MLGARASAGAEDATAFVGTWTLVSAIHRLPDGSRATTLLGDVPLGVLVYTDEGHMSAHLSRSDRLHFASSDRYQGTPDEIRAAFESYAGYTGRYAIDWQHATVTHKVTICSFPNWVGTEQKRFFELIGDRLTLRTPPYPLGGQTVRGELVWQRVN